MPENIFNDRRGHLNTRNLKHAHNTLLVIQLTLYQSFSTLPIRITVDVHTMHFKIQPTDLNNNFEFIHSMKAIIQLWIYIVLNWYGSGDGLVTTKWNGKSNTQRRGAFIIT